MSELARSHSVQGTRWDWYSVASVLTFVAEAVKDSVANLQLVLSPLFNQNFSVVCCGS
jgi:hypothetical protein